MLDIMYELPEHAGSSYLINEAMVGGRERVLPIPEPKNKSA